MGRIPDARIGKLPNQVFCRSQIPKSIAGLSQGIIGNRIRVFKSSGGEETGSFK
jgi:hypothetical protein